jgi:hypothetical protein
MKQFLALLYLCVGISFTGLSQTATEPQPFPLTDFKITFHETQMNAETVAVTLMDGSDILGNQPKIIFNEAANSFTIDFTDCVDGKYLISGKRDDLKLEYSVDR